MLSVEAQRKQELQRKLTKLLGKSDLSAKQQKKLARLQAIDAMPSDSPQAIEVQQGQGDVHEERSVFAKKRASVEPGSAAPAAKRVYKNLEPCRDEGHWGDDGEWVYPADREIVCSRCQTQFTFSGVDQAWYAKRELYAPARCSPCRNAKKEAKEIKQKSGKSGEGRCFNCGATGHGTANCPKERSEQKMCYVCGSSAHLSRNCPSALSKKSALGCFTCGSTAHLSRECPQRPPPVCFNCGKAGHSQKACDQPLRTEGKCFAFASNQCFNKKCKFTH